MSEPVLRLEAVVKEYRTDGVATRVLHGVDLVLQAGELAALVGPSGSGKSTLLNVIGLLEPPTSGGLWVAGEDVRRASEERITELRGRSIGFVFQFHHLITAFTAAENVMMPLVLEEGRVRAGMRARAVAALARVGLGDRANARPTELSGGQQQRVAVARALMRSPPLILADEPTGNLDTESADGVFQLLREHNRGTGAAFLIVTHDPRLAARCDRIIELVDGRVKSDRPAAASEPTPAPTQRRID
jgi:lipoprotein-releasing system ATP-binding protein